MANKNFSDKDKKAVFKAFADLKKTYNKDIETAQISEIHLYLALSGDYQPYKILAMDEDRFHVQKIDDNGKLAPNQFWAPRHKFIRCNYHWGDVLKRRLDDRIFLVRRVAIQFNEYILFVNEIMDYDTVDEEVTNREQILSNLADLDLIGYREGYNM